VERNYRLLKIHFLLYNNFIHFVLIYVVITRLDAREIWNGSGSAKYMKISYQKTLHGDRVISDNVQGDLDLNENCVDDLH
jgi:hypothetical protein